MTRKKPTREELAGAFMDWMEQHGYIWFDADLTLAETLASFLGIKLGARAAFALGYLRLITYTQADELGASLRAANFRLIAQRPPNRGWSMPSRPRADIGSAGVARQLWEKVA